MDILDIVRKQIGLLPDAPHVRGLRSVVRHIETADRHLNRGRDQQDDSAFTDAIYRTNQAFEGSIKEAYRVLAGKDPSKTTPSEIEKYLEKRRVFRERVLAQFSIYRREWRNPSTHDYNLDFDEDEAFLAIVSVSAFAKLLVDQIAEQTAYTAVQEDVRVHRIRVRKRRRNATPLTRVGFVCEEFLEGYLPKSPSITIDNEAQLIGALTGYLSSVSGDIKVVDQRGKSSSNCFADLLVSSGREKIAIELKKGKPRDRLVMSGIFSLQEQIENGGADGGILIFYSRDKHQYVTKQHNAATTKLLIITPDDSESA